MEWTKYTTKEALKDNDELMILDTDGKANKRTLMDKIWNYVVDKMTTAVIAKLGTTNKTLIGAVNELNSNKLLNGNVNSYSTNYNTSNRTTIEINLGDRANSVQALLMDKNRMIYISAYTDDGKNITEIKISTIYGEKVTPSVNNTVISVSIGSWITGTALISYSINKPTFSIK